MGLPLARVAGDPALQILVVRRSEAWGVVRNELDVPSVVR